MKFLLFANQSPKSFRNHQNPNSGFQKTGDGSSSSWKQLFEVRWLRIAVLLVVFLLFLLLWDYVSYKSIVLIFTVLPLFVGYGFSYLLEPVNHFFCRFFSEKVSKIIVFIFFLIFTLGLVLGLFFIFFIQLDDLYKKFFYQTGKLETFLKSLGQKERQEIKNVNFVKIDDDTFRLTYDVVNFETDSKLAPATPILLNKNEVAGIFILLLKLVANFNFLKGICFSSMDWLYKNVTNYGYLEVLWANWQSILLFLYLLFFTIVIGAFSLGKGSGFFQKIWNFLTRDQDLETAEKLKVELKRNLSAWGKGLLIVELYIMIGTGLFLFTAGIIFSSWSSYDESSLVLTLFMTLCNLIPYIGPAIGFVPIISIGLIDVVSHGSGLFISWVPFIIAISGCLLIQFGESTLVSPLVYSHKVKLDPIVIIVGLGLTGVVFGILWMPLAIPVILVIKIVYQTFYPPKSEIIKH